MKIKQKIIAKQMIFLWRLVFDIHLYIMLMDFHRRKGKVRKRLFTTPMKAPAKENLNSINTYKFQA